MIRYLIILMLVSSVAKAQVTDDFSDGDFTNNPAWSGDVGAFIVNASQQLQLNSSGTGISYLSSTLNLTSLDSSEWRCYVSQTFSGSASNNGKIYLTSDQANLEGPLNGYFIQLGEALSNDAVELFKQSGTTVTSIARGTNAAIANSFAIGVKVTRSNNAEWKLYVDYGGGTNYLFQAGGTDATFNTSAFFGVVCTYTSSNSTNFYYDNFSYGPIQFDNISPTIIFATATSSTTVDVLFSEAVDLTTSETETNYNVNNGIGTPTSAIRNAGNISLVTLTFAGAFTSGQLNTLTVNNVADVNSNIIAVNSTTTFTYNAPVTAQPFDVVISEIMFEPESGTQLPNAEYVEIYNRSSGAINLNGWLLSDGGSLTPNFGNYSLPAGQYLILCSTTNAAAFAAFGNVLALSSFPSLNNDVGDDLKLFDNNSVLIDEVVFDNDFYNNPAKDDNGYSIEKVDLNFTCTDVANWRASEDIKGGTPGAQNSVNGTFNDNTSPQLVSAYPVSTIVVDVFFSEPVDAGAAFIANNYSISGGIGTPLNVVPFKNKVTLTLGAALQPGTIYSITVIDTIRDCPGNLIEGDLTVKVGLADNVTTGNLQINEILFNPVTDGYDYVELYNSSAKIIDLKNVYIANVNLTTNAVDDKEIIYPEGRLIFPSDIIALTENAAATTLKYPTDVKRNILEIASLPSYNDDEGGVAVTDFALNVLDQFNYSEDYHYPILNDKEGVSLERISITAPTQNKTNWHSAAQSVHYGTPGYRNSQSIISLTSQELGVDPEVFSPDNDGYNDVLSINYNLGETGYTATVSIFDGDGREIKTIANNELVPRWGSYYWDGINDKNEKARIGIYVVMMEATNINGNKKKLKKGFVLAGKL